MAAPDPDGKRPVPPPRARGDAPPRISNAGSSAYHVEAMNALQNAARVQVEAEPAGSPERDQPVGSPEVPGGVAGNSATGGVHEPFPIGVGMRQRPDARIRNEQAPLPEPREPARRPSGARGHEAQRALGVMNAAIAQAMRGEREGAEGVQQLAKEFFGGNGGNMAAVRRIAAGIVASLGNAVLETASAVGRFYETVDRTVCPRQILVILQPAIKVADPSIEGAGHKAAPQVVIIFDRYKLNVPTIQFIARHEVSKSTPFLNLSIPFTDYTVADTSTFIAGDEVGFDFSLDLRELKKRLAEGAKPVVLDLARRMGRENVGVAQAQRDPRPFEPLLTDLALFAQGQVRWEVSQPFGSSPIQGTAAIELIIGRKFDWESAGPERMQDIFLKNAIDKTVGLVVGLAVGFATSNSVLGHVTGIAAINMARFLVSNLTANAQSASAAFQTGFVDYNSRNLFETGGVVGSFNVYTRQQWPIASSNDIQEFRMNREEELNTGVDSKNTRLRVLHEKIARVETDLRAAAPAAEFVRAQAALQRGTLEALEVAKREIDDVTQRRNRREATLGQADNPFIQNQGAIVVDPDLSQEAASGSDSGGIRNVDGGTALNVRDLERLELQQLKALEMSMRGALAQSLGIGDDDQLNERIQTAKDLVKDSGRVLERSDETVRGLQDARQVLLRRRETLTGSIAALNDERQSLVDRGKMTMPPGNAEANAPNDAADNAPNVQIELPGNAEANAPNDAADNAPDVQIEPSGGGQPDVGNDRPDDGQPAAENAQPRPVRPDAANGRPNDDRPPAANRVQGDELRTQRILEARTERREASILNGRREESSRAPSMETLMKFSRVIESLVRFAAQDNAPNRAE